MILIFEMVWPGTGHSVTNGATIQTIASAFPHQSVRVFAEETHLRELQADAGLACRTNLFFDKLRISPHYLYRPHIVSIRRGLRELSTLISALRLVPSAEPCLIVLLSATPTAIFAAATLSRLLPNWTGIHVGMHGNLNDAFGWRSRNPVRRMIDLHAALSARHGGRVRFLVLEHTIKTALAERIHIAEETTDVLPLPVNEGEAVQAAPTPPERPLRIGLVGQATEAKGIGPFLEFAEHFRITHSGMVAFHLVGHPVAGANIDAFAVLDDFKPGGRPSRQEFVEKLARLHYVCLPLKQDYYGLAASGALIDAITWLKPVIATRIPLITDLFERFGDIGFLCDSVEQMRDVIADLIGRSDHDRYGRQVANLQRLRESRQPRALAALYRGLIERSYPELFLALKGAARV